MRVTETVLLLSGRSFFTDPYETASARVQYEHILTTRKIQNSFTLSPSIYQSMNKSAP